jgi:Tfp pilus assembly major pilin PilA
MIVVGIMAIVLTMGVPLVYQLAKKEPFRKAMSDIEQICMEARRRAILQGAEVKLVFYADGRIEINGGAPTSTASGNSGGGAPAEMAVAQAGGSSAGAVRLSENIGYELLSVDHIDYLDREQMSVSFRPNGTCDEMVLVLLSDKNERTKIWLEVTTALVNFETDPRRF